MKFNRSKLFIPVLAGLVGIGATAAYQLSQSKSLPGLTSEAFAAEEASVQGAQGAEQGAFHPAPDFALKDLNGNTVRLSDYKGKVVMLNFWATWCPPCRREIPDFNELQKQYGGQGLQIIGIALDDEGAAKVKPYVQNNPISYPVLLPDNTVVSKYGEMSAIPVTFLIDRSGNIRTSYVGGRQKAVVESMIKPLLAGQ